MSDRPSTQARPLSTVAAIGASCALALAAGIAGAAPAESEQCPAMFLRGTLKFPHNVSFLEIAHFKDEKGAPRDALLLSSFYNVEKNAEGNKVERYSRPDFAAWIPDLDAIDPANFDAVKAVDVITDVGREPAEIWPNHTHSVPEGTFPFQAVVIPGGFLSADRPGRLTIVNVDDPKRTQYLIDDFGKTKPSCKDGKVVNDQWWYHQAEFHDMDGDGYKDLITARGNFKPFAHGCPFGGDLVWFKNPGKALQADKEWEEHVLVGLPDVLDGPEVNLDMADLDNDGVPEIIATHFFTNDHITIFGAPEGKTWTDVTKGKGKVRRKAIMSGHGRPFAVEAVDLDGDGRKEVLTSNHQGDNCYDMTKDPIPGRVLALEQPKSGKIFSDDWTTHVLKDNIRPNKTFPAPTRAPGRLAPNKALAFWPVRSLEGKQRPWIVVGGDEASKIWVLKPKGGKDTWAYDSHVIFDINVHYGPNTSQTLLKDPPGIKVSTIGGLIWRYDRPGADGHAEIYAPVFEAREVQILTFRQGTGKAISCTADTFVGCSGEIEQ